MEYSAACTGLVKQFESCSLASYPDPIGIWTVGYGHTRGVKRGQTISQQQAEDFLNADLTEAAGIVNSAVTVPLSQSQFDALSSFVYNVGPGARDGKDGFVVLKNGNLSGILRALNASDYRGAADRLLLWNHAAGKVLAGLTRRRNAERALFLS